MDYMHRQNPGSRLRTAGATETAHTNKISANSAGLKCEHVDKFGNCKTRGNICVWGFSSPTRVMSPPPE